MYRFYTSTRILQLLCEHNMPCGKTKFFSIEAKGLVALPKRKMT